MNRWIFSGLLCVLCARAWCGDLDLERRVVEHTCPNGITLLIVERHFSPNVSVRMMFRAGAVDEVSGKTGLAHMFEHMMFKGTRTLGTKNYAAEAPLLDKLVKLNADLDAEKSKGPKANQGRIAQLIDAVRAVERQESAWIVDNEVMNLYEQAGASEINAGTSADFTQYLVDLPSNKLLLWAIVDADRVRNPVFRQFYQEREVVEEERRLRVDTSPSGQLFENFLAAAYLAHPYRHPTIGWPSDIEHLTVADLDRFYRRHYTPGRLTIAVVGDVHPQQVIEWVDHYFGSWKSAVSSAVAFATEEPPQTGPRRVEVGGEAQPELLIGYHIPTYPDPDHPVYFALSQLLTSGTTSRLYKALVEKKEIATAVDSSPAEPGELFNTLFTISAQPRYPHSAQEVEKGIREELMRLKTRPVEPWELEKVRAAVHMNLLDTLQSNGGMASMLAYDQTIFGDWHYLLRFEQSVHLISAGDIQRVALKAFIPENETVAILKPKMGFRTPEPEKTGESILERGGPHASH